MAGSQAQALEEHDQATTIKLCEGLAVAIVDRRLLHKVHFAPAAPPSSLVLAELSRADRRVARPEESRAFTHRHRPACPWPLSAEVSRHLLAPPPRIYHMACAGVVDARHVAGLAVAAPAHFCRTYVGTVRV